METFFVGEVISDPLVFFLKDPLSCYCFSKLYNLHNSLK